MTIVTDGGFRPSTPVDWVGPEALDGEGEGFAVLIPNDVDPAPLVRHFGRIALIAAPFPGFADGRSLSLAQRLRALGYAGRLRAKGHVIADQWPRLKAVGFDEAEIDEALAARQPEAQWRVAAQAPVPPFRLRREAARAAAAAADAA
jgi:uncharacterized protein (DUF934 family)